MHQRPTGHEPLHVGPFELDLRARELRRDGQRIRLQDKPFELIAALVERPGDVVSREELRQRLWPADTFVAFDDSLNTAINKAREALGDSAESPRFIQTVPRRGYRFIAPVTGNGWGTGSIAAPAPPDARARRRVAVATISVAAAILLVIGSVVAFRGRATPPPALVRFQIQPPDATRFPGGMTRFALSPDGRRLAFSAVSLNDRIERIYVQSLNSSAAEPLPGSDGPVDICWSPDGQAIAFTARARLWRYDFRDKSVRLLADGDREVRSLAWSATGGILVGRPNGSGLYRLSPDAGSEEPVTTLDAAREETMHLWPQWLPDGRSFLYLAVSRQPPLSGVYLARVGEPTRRLVLASPLRASFVEPDILLYPKDSRLMAQRFDVSAGTLTGAAVEIAPGLATSPGDGAVALSVASPGVLAFANRPRLPSRELVWIDRSGRRIGTASVTGHYANLFLSPDERFVALETGMPDVQPAAPDLFVLDVSRNVSSRLTNSPANDEGAVWDAGSKRFVYARHRAIRERSDLYLKDLREPDRDQPLLVDETGNKHPFDWSADGRLLLYGLGQPKSPRQDIWVLPFDGDPRPYPWLATPFDESEARFSPDGRWVAYESDETGIREVMVRAFRSPAVRIQISAGGGTQPRWSRDGTELYYVSDYHLMTVPVRAGAILEPGAPQPLFEFRRLQPVPTMPTPYAVSGSRDRFLVGAVVDEGGPSPVTVVLNWTQIVGARD